MWPYSMLCMTPTTMYQDMWPYSMLCMAPTTMWQDMWPYSLLCRAHISCSRTCGPIPYYVWPTYHVAGHVALFHTMYDLHNYVAEHVALFHTMYGPHIMQHDMWPYSILCMAHISCSRTCGPIPYYVWPTYHVAGHVALFHTMYSSHM